MNWHPFVGNGLWKREDKRSENSFLNWKTCTAFLSFWSRRLGFSGHCSVCVLVRLVDPPDLAWRECKLKTFSGDHLPTQNEITSDLAWCKFTLNFFFLDHPPAQTPDLDWCKFELFFFSGPPSVPTPTHPKCPKWDNTRFGLIQIETENCFSGLPTHQNT